MKNSLVRQIESLINGVVEPMEQNGCAIINPSDVANRVDHLIDPERLSPELKTFASVEQLKDIVRRYLARRHDPVLKSRIALESGQQDIFGGILQDYYPVKRETEKGFKIPVYTKRENLTESDIYIIHERMTKAGKSLIKHADALKAWHKKQIKKTAT